MTGETLEILTYWYWVKVPRAPIIITAATLQLLILTETARSRMGPWGGDGAGGGRSARTSQPGLYHATNEPIT